MTKQKLKSILDFCKIPRSQGESARVGSVLSEGEVSVDTSREDKALPAEISWSGGGGALHKSSKKRVITSIVSSVLVCLVIALNVLPKPGVQAATISELRARSAQLQAEINANKKRANELGEHASTLKARIDQLSIEIENANKQIELTTVKIAELEAELKRTEAELERQKGLLKASMRALYKRGGASTVELLAASDSFSQFINDQEYLERLKVAIQDSTEKVIALKQQIEDQKKGQEDLKKQQEQQRNVLASKRAEQKSLFDQTKGEEARYQALVSSYQKALEEAEAQLTKLLTARNFVSLGPVSRGDVIGAVGSTGYSTGPHLHFMTKQNGESRNPSTGGRGLINGYSWPVLGDSYVSTPYGYVHCRDYTGCHPPGSSYYVFHSGLDIAADYHTPVVAAADGQIVFRGCSSGLGYVVVVDHGDGWQTWYPHMVTSGGQVSGYCG